MKFKIDNDVLTKVIKVLSNVVPDKTTVIATQNILFTRDNEDVILTATNLEITCKVRVKPDQIEGDKQLLIPCSFLENATEAIGQQKITLEAIENAVNIEWENGRMTLPSYDCKDFPPVPDITAENTIKIQAAMLATGLDRVAFATGEDEMRPILNGVNFDIIENGLTLVGTDSRKLICYNISLNSEKKFNFLMSNGMVTLTKKILKTKEIDPEMQVRFLCDNNNYGYTVGDFTVTGKKIQGKYPKYRDVIPQYSQNILSIKRADFVGTLNRMKVFANKKSLSGTSNSAMKLVMNEITGVEASIQDIAFNMGAKETLDDAVYHGTDITIGLNLEALLSVLNHRTSEKINMLFIDNRRPVIIEDVPDSNNQIEPIVSVMMPTKVIED